MADALGVLCSLTALALAGAVLVRGSRARDALVLLFAPLALVLFLAAVERSAPGLYARWVEEDRWVEWATFVAFVLAAVAFVRRARGADTTLTRVVFGGLALFCVVVAGEEISWAQRLLYLEPPETFLVENYQQELNVHNLITRREVAGVELDTKTLVGLIGALYGLSAVAAMWMPRPAFITRLAPTAPPLEVAPTLLVVAALEAFYPWEKTGEVAELALGVGMLLSSLARPPLPSAPRVGQALGATVIGGVLLSAVTGVALTALGADRVPQARAELEALAADVADPNAVSQSRQRYKSVHKRLFTAVKQGRIKIPVDGQYLQGEPSPAIKAQTGKRDRRHYFLDPWGNAYWMRYLRRHEVLWLYSFGPDGRRDSDLGKRIYAQGDDVVIRVDYPREGPRGATH